MLDFRVFNSPATKYFKFLQLTENQRTISRMYCGGFSENI